MSPRGGRRRVLGAALVLAFLGVVFAVVLPRLASYEDVLAAVGDLTWIGIVGLAVAVVLNVVTFAPPWMAALPGLTLGRALALTQAATAAASTLPGGEAVGIALSVTMLRRWGFRPSQVTLATVVVSAWNQLAKAAFPLVALGGLIVFGEAQGPLAVAAVAGLAVLAVLVGAGTAALASERRARWVGDRVGVVISVATRLLRREPVVGAGDRLVRFRLEALALLRRRWAAITAATFAGHLAQFAVLVIALRALGVERTEVNLLEAFAAWSVVRLVATIPITPGGIGIIELGMSTSLIAFGGDDAEVVAAVLLYRVLAWFPTILIGIPCLLLWRRLQLEPTAGRSD